MSLWQTAKSVLAAFFGVQSPENRERDFRQGDPASFIIVGLIMTIVFMVTLFSIVNYMVL
jgi:hypothetical protein